MRSRRGLVAVLLVGLVATFTAGAVVHHLADHAGAGTATMSHDDGGYDAAICVGGAAACGIALLLMGLIGLGFARIPASPVVRRWRRLLAGGGLSPGRFVVRPRQRAELQCFLT